MNDTPLRYAYVRSPRELSDLIDRLEGAETVAFDTEFVSEHSYRPELCLIQVAADGVLAAIDTLAIDDVTPFWRFLVEHDHQTVVHAGREEFRFVRTATDRHPEDWFDVQIAAGLVGFDYPAALGNLLGTYVGVQVAKGEARTDWRRRPLAPAQIEYALQDVLHLEELRNVLEDRLEKLGRLEWLYSEIDSWQVEQLALESNERWIRGAGIGSLSPRMLAVYREVWLWRESEAARRDQPLRRVLRDDLLVELAKRRTADPKSIRMIRGLDRGDLQGQIPALARAVERGLSLPETELPQLDKTPAPPQMTLLVQFLSSALGSVCRHAQVASSLVGTANDLRDFLADRMGLRRDESEPPALAQGWRAEVIGSRIDEIISGKLAVRVARPKADDPLGFIPVTEAMLDEETRVGGKKTSEKSRPRSGQRRRPSDEPRDGGR